MCRDKHTHIYRLTQTHISVTSMEIDSLYDTAEPHELLEVFSQESNGAGYRVNHGGMSEERQVISVEEPDEVGLPAVREPLAETQSSNESAEMQRGVDDVINEDEGEITVFLFASCLLASGGVMAVHLFSTSPLPLFLIFSCPLNTTCILN